MRAIVHVTLKRSVLDPAGQAVLGALARLGYGEVTDVRLGKRIELELAGEDPEAAKARIEKMCKELLANTVIEDYRIEV